jgi:glucuronosyltransferase
MHKNSPYRALSFASKVAGALTNFTLSHENVQKILNSDTKFDLFILDLFIYDAVLGISNHFGIPTVVFSSAGTMKWTNEMVKNPVNPSYNPNMLLPYTDKMSFSERLQSVFYGLFEEYIYRFVNLPKQEMIYKEHFGKFGKPLPRLIDLVHNVNLVLLNTHPIFQLPRAFVPNMVEVGGIHLKTNGSLLGEVYPNNSNELQLAIPININLGYS